MEPKVGQYWKYRIFGMMYTIDKITDIYIDEDNDTIIVSDEVYRNDGFRCDPNCEEVLEDFIQNAIYIPAYNTPLYKLLNCIENTDEEEE